MCWAGRGSRMPDGRPVEALPLAVSDPRIRPGAGGPRDRETYSAGLDETELIKRYAPLVKRIAAHLKGRLPDTVQLDDLTQAGLVAVLRLSRHGALSLTAE